jgi:hypothetical protein
VTQWFHSSSQVIILPQGAERRSFPSFIQNVGDGEFPEILVFAFMPQSVPDKTRA